MKNKNNVARIETWRPGIVEIGLLALPLLALVPNVFIAPALSMVGLATQELAVAAYGILVSLAAIWESWRRRDGGIRIERRDLYLIGALLLFTGWQLTSLLYTPTKNDGFRLVAIWVIFGTFLVLQLLRLSPKLARVIFHLLTFICLVLAVTILYERYIFGPVMLGFFFNHGITAEILVTLVPVQVASFFKARQKALMALYFVVSSVGIVAI
ncbi:MAG: hypothetical protein ACK496_15595, partial [Acidobacteriota bacterium]